MTPLIKILPFIFCFQLTAQYGIFSNIQYKRHFPDPEEWFLMSLKGSDSLVTCMRYYFMSDDTIYFREYPSQHIHKINKTDLNELPFNLGKDFHFSRQAQDLNSSALKPKIMLGLSLGSIVGIAIDLAQPNPLFINYPSYYALPLIFIAGYAQAKKIDRYLNYYQLAEVQKFSKLEPEQQLFSSNELHAIDTAKIESNPDISTLSQAFGYDNVASSGLKNLITKAGCQYRLSEFYFESDGFYYFAIEGQEGSYCIAKDQIVNDNEIYNIGNDRHFTDQKRVIAKAKTGKALGILYGVFGTLTFGIIGGSIGSGFGSGVTSGLGLGVLPASLIIAKCNKTLEHYAIFNSAQRVTCN